MCISQSDEVYHKMFIRYVEIVNSIYIGLLTVNQQDKALKGLTPTTHTTLIGPLITTSILTFHFVYTSRADFKFN